MWSPMWSLSSTRYLLVCGVLFTLAELTIGIPYANNYPYSEYGYSADSRYLSGGSGGDSGGVADVSGFRKSQYSDRGNDMKHAQDTGKFYNTDNLVKGHDISHMKHGTSTDAQKQTNGENFENDKSHNRKHVKSGFSNSYHKDESGSNSSFYEDSDDRGGKVVYDKRHGTKGQANGNRYREGEHDGASRDRYDDRKGGYDSRGLHDRKQYSAEDVGKRHGHRDGYSTDQEERYQVVDERRHSPHLFTAGGGGGGGGGGVGVGGYTDRYHPVIERLPHRGGGVIGVSGGGGGGGGYYQPHHHQNHHRYNGIGLGKPYAHHGGLSAPVHLPPLAHNRGREDGYFTRQRITIYEDPRDIADPRADRRRGDFLPPLTATGGGGGGGYHSSRLDYRPSPVRHLDYDDDLLGYRRDY